MISIINMRLGKDFFNCNARQLARKLLGKKLVRRWRGKTVSGIITETEAYCGLVDKACHAYGGRRTARTEVMYRPAGHVYMFFVYGMHWQFNIVARGDGQAVLVRSVVPLLRNATTKSIRTDGPGRLCTYFNFGKSLYGEHLTTSPSVWLELGLSISPEQIIKTPRIGLKGAAEWNNKRLRFVIPPEVVADDSGEESL